MKYLNYYSEWIGTMTAIGLISELLENMNQNSDIMTGLDWIIVPVANPDGYYYTHEVVSKLFEFVCIHNYKDNYLI